MEDKYPTTKLATVAEIVMGQSPPGSTYNEAGEGLPFYQGVVDFGAKYPSRRVFCSAPSRIAKTGDILFSVRAPIGHVNIATERCCVGRGLSVIKPKDLEDRVYIEFVLRAMPSMWNIFEGGGSVFGNAKKEDLQSLEIVWPQKTERHAIAAILGALDDKIELNRQMNQTLEAMAQALFKNWFVDFEPFRDQGMEESPLGPIPRGWRVATISDVGDVICGKTPPTRDPSNYGGSIPFVTIPDMHNKVFVTSTGGHLTEKGGATQSKKLLPKHAVCVSCIATPGLVALTSQPSHTNQQINSIICNDNCSPFWCYLAMISLRHEIITGGAGGSATLNLNKSEFSKLQVIKPNQVAMWKFHKIVEPFLSLILSNELENIKLADIRDSLLPKLLSGEIRVKAAEKFVEEAV